MGRLAWGSIAILFVALSPIAHAEMLTAGASQDNTLYYDDAGSFSNGSGSYFFTGLTNSTSPRRGLVAFNLSGVPAGATINAVTLRLHMSRTIAGSVAVAVHRVEDSWGEGESNAGGNEGSGAPSQANDATWTHRYFDFQDWSTPGGDFDSVASASRAVGGSGFYTWTSAALAADVQFWVDSPSRNYGWLLKSDETLSPPTAKRWDSRENSNVSFRPALIIAYTPVPEPAAAALLAAGMLALLRRAR